MANQADRVRECVLQKYVQPARLKHEHVVAVRAGDVHAELNFVNRFPLVCAALGSDKLLELGNLRRLSIDGPLNGANTLFVYRVL